VSPAVTIAEDATRRNGTGAAMPIKTAVVAFDEVGYPGWHATLRTNPRASVYDDFLSQDQERFWRTRTATRCRCPRTAWIRKSCPTT
jgi:hypothetical protein